MKKWILGSLIVLGFAGAVHAEEQEAWITRSSFDGTLFKYEYTAYGVGTKVSDRVLVSCDYRKMGTELVLKAVQVKIMIDGDFSEDGVNMIRSGQVDVRLAVKDCLQDVPNLKQGIQVPVQIQLPSISLPVQQ